MIWIAAYLAIGIVVLGLVAGAYLLTRRRLGDSRLQVGDDADAAGARGAYRDRIGRDGDAGSQVGGEEQNVI